MLPQLITIAIQLRQIAFQYTFVVQIQTEETQTGGFRLLFVSAAQLSIDRFLFLVIPALALDILKRNVAEKSFRSRCHATSVQARTTKGWGNIAPRLTLYSVETLHDSENRYQKLNTYRIYFVLNVNRIINTHTPLGTSYPDITASDWIQRPFPKITGLIL